MRKFKKKNKQIREENVREIARIVKESFEKLKEEELKNQIIIPKPEKIYCIEYKFYATEKDYNEELNNRISSVSFRQKTAYEKGKSDTAKKILTVLCRTPLEDLRRKTVELAREYHISTGDLL